MCLENKNLMNFSPYNPKNIEQIKQLFTKVFSDSEGQSEGLLIGDLVYDLIANTDAKDLYGFVAIKNQEIIDCQSKPNLKIVDLTGAGDLFAAGFLHGLINNISTKECLEKGTEMSSKIIQKIGARLN